jgi:hypothetical protein
MGETWSDGKVSGVRYVTGLPSATKIIPAPLNVEGQLVHLIIAMHLVRDVAQKNWPLSILRAASSSIPALIVSRYGLSNAATF